MSYEYVGRGCDLNLKRCVNSHCLNMASWKWCSCFKQNYWWLLVVPNWKTYWHIYFWNKLEVKHFDVPSWELTYPLYIFKGTFFQDDFPFLQVGYVSFVEGTSMEWFLLQDKKLLPAWDVPLGLELRMGFWKSELFWPQNFTKKMSCPTPNIHFLEINI